MMPERNKKLLVVDDDPMQVKLLERLLRKGEHQILTAKTGREAMRIVLSEEPRVVITDLIMPDMDGLELCRALRQHEGVRFVYILVTSARGDEKSVVDAFDAGADDFVAKPVREAELLARLRAADRIVCAESALARRTREVHRINAEMAMAHERLNLANEQLRRMATTDELTGLLNRREGFARLDEYTEAARRYHYELSCIMIDIDHFKSFNDTYGHAAGDYVLRETARILRANTRGTDRVCRIGGEEFLIICQGVGLDGAMQCAEHVRRAIEQTTLRYEKADLRITASSGVATWTPELASKDELLRLADDALYQSKRAGRNRVTAATGSSPPPPVPALDVAGNGSPT